MRDAASEAVALAAGRTRADLDSDRLLMLSLVRLLEVLGEAANGVSLAFRTSHPEVPWRSLVGMRNRLIHAYHEVNLDVVWRTIQDDRPPLIACLEAILAPPSPDP